MCGRFCSGPKRKGVCVRQGATLTRGSKVIVRHAMIPGSSISLASTRAGLLQIFGTWSTSMAPHPSISQWRIDFSLTDPVSTAAMVTKLLVGMQLLRLGMALAISLSGIVGVHLGVMTVTSSLKTRHVRCFDILLGSTLLQFLAQTTGPEQPQQPRPQAPQACRGLTT